MKPAGQPYDIQLRGSVLHKRVHKILETWGRRHEGIVSKAEVESILESVEPGDGNVGYLVNLFDFDEDGNIDALQLCSQASMRIIFWDRGDKAESDKAREDFASMCRKARELMDIPSWVEGPRPSDEALAKHPYVFLDKAPHRDEGPLGDGKEKRENSVTFEQLAGHALRTRQMRCIPSGWEQKYQLPTSFVPCYANADGVPCVWANWPGTSEESGIILNIHGGGCETVDTNIHECARWSLLTQMRVLTVHYRLIPEYSILEQVEDYLQAYRWLLKSVGPDKIAMKGDSSGAMVLILALQALVKEGLPPPACALPMSSMWIGTGSSFHWQSIVGDLGFFRKPKLHASHGGDSALTWEQIVSDPRFNFFEGDFRGLPPLHLSVGSIEGRGVAVVKEMVKRARDAEVVAEYDEVPNIDHVPGFDACLVPEETAFIARQASFIRKYIP